MSFYPRELNEGDLIQVPKVDHGPPYSNLAIVLRVKWDGSTLIVLELYHLDTQVKENIFLRTTEPLYEKIGWKLIQKAS